MDLNGRICVVTGVSKGIGHALVVKLLEENAIVYGLGRNAPDFEHQNFHFLSTDVRRQSEVDKSFDDILAESKKIIHVLINNAGLGYFGTVESLNPEHWEEMVNTNINGMFYCTRRAVPGMKKAGYGHLINIASTAALEGMAEVSGYCATKFAVKGFSESLYKELRDYKIKVTCVYPGSVKTDFFRNSREIKPHDYMLVPEDVAEMIVWSIKTPDNFHQVNLEVRPLQPKGPKKNPDEIAGA